MTITATPGAVTITDQYGLIGCSGPQLTRLPMTVYKSCQQWGTDDGLLMADLGIQSSVTTTSDPAVSVSASVPYRYDAEKEVKRNVSYTSDWNIYSSEDFGRLTGETNKTVKDLGQDAPSVTVADFSVNTTAAEYSVKTNVHGLLLRETNSATVEAAEINALEITGIYDESNLPATSGEFSLFDAEMPCSAYLMKVLVSDNANAVGFKTLNSISFPFTGVGSHV
jgi:hypothetical protein